MDAEHEPYRNSIYIDAPPSAVFDYFTEPAAIAEWMSDRAEVDARPGGVFLLYFGDKCVEGAYVEVDPPRRLVISWGRRDSPTLPPRSSTLEVSLEPSGAGTTVHILHSGLPETEAARHRAGWDHYLERLRILVSGGRVAPHVNPPELSAGAD